MDGTPDKRQPAPDEACEGGPAGGPGRGEVGGPQGSKYGTLPLT